MPAFVSIVMGSKSDWPTMQHAADTLKGLDIACESRVLSAHRTPEALEAYIAEAEARGVAAFIAGAGGAAHLAGVIAAKTLVPVLGVPIESKLQGLDSLLSMVQMPGGIPVATFAVGRAGAVNAALFAAAMLARSDEGVRGALSGYREEQASKILAQPDPSVE